MFKIIDSKNIEIAGKRISFPCTLSWTSDRKGYYVLEHENLVIVNFYPNTMKDSEDVFIKKISLDRNIWAFNQLGEKVWEIEAVEDIFDSKKPHPPYTSVYLENGELRAFNIQGLVYIINPENGKVTVIPSRPW